MNMVSWLLPLKGAEKGPCGNVDEKGPIYRAAPNRVLVNDPAFTHQIFSWERATYCQPTHEAWGGVFIACQEGSNKVHAEERKRLTPAVRKTFALLLAELC